MKDNHAPKSSAPKSNLEENGSRPSSRQDYSPQHLEQYWTKQWQEQGLYELDNSSAKPRFYWLTMLPYPSGDLHIGHWYAMAPSDAGARFKRMNGYNVFFPIGFDAFGLPAENAAIKNNIHPHDWTYSNIERMRKQLQRMGAMWSWNNEIISCEPEYYKWSQWMFLKFLEHDLAYQEYSAVDFCPDCNTTLAREQVVGDDRLCERCTTPVIRKKLKQWKLRITKYSEDLLNFEGIDWPERVRSMQENWIGKSNGLRFWFKVKDSPEKFLVYTTRPDTIAGATFCVLSPEHPLVDKLTTAEHQSAVAEYRTQAERKTEIERKSAVQDKSGVFIGSYAINPLNNEAIPIWIADYVLMEYGTGAIMAVPAHDDRDYAFAQQYNLSIVPVIKPLHGEVAKDTELPYVAKEGSQTCFEGQFNNLAWPQSFEQICRAFEEQGLGERVTEYRLRDWLISRQRMWGTPIPIIYCPKCGAVPVPYSNLPVELPRDAVFKPTGESPLASHEGFLNVECPRCYAPSRRETDTMDTFICSSWYMYAYLSPYWKRGQTLSADDCPWDKEIIEQWLPIAQYTGGIEHATMHLLYLRFFARALIEVGAMNHAEPIKRLYNQGIILGEDSEKMSKSRGNVINPDGLVDQYGADAVRIYLMFIGPWEAGGPWNSRGVVGVVRFLSDLWQLVVNDIQSATSFNPQQLLELKRMVHKALYKVGDDYARFKFNTLIAVLMSLRNFMKSHCAQLKGSPEWDEALRYLVLMLAPIAPFITEELWQRLGNTTSVHLEAWPAYDKQYVVDDTITLVVQINGKHRDSIEIEASTINEQLKDIALAAPRIQALIGEKPIKRIIPVGNKLVNIVI